MSLPHAEQVSDLKTASFRQICLEIKPSVALTCTTAVSMTISTHRKTFSRVSTAKRGTDVRPNVNISSRKKKKKPVNTVNYLFIFHVDSLAAMVNVSINSCKSCQSVLEQDTFYAISTLTFQLLRTRKSPRRPVTFNV